MKQLELPFEAGASTANPATETPKPRAASVFPFPAARNLVHVHAVAHEIAALPKGQRARAWSHHAYRMLKTRREAGVSRNAAVADALAFRDEVRLLVKYIDTSPATGRGGAA